jgi:UDP-glucose 6-dehydrogenase
MEITNAVTGYRGWKNNTCFAELYPQFNGTYIYEVKMNTLQKNDSQLFNISIKELLHSYKPPNVLNSRMSKDKFVLNK